MHRESHSFGNRVRSKDVWMSNLKRAVWSLASAAMGLLPLIANARLDLENSVPANWSATSGALSISSSRWKLGAQSLRWDWIGGSTLTIQSPGIAAADVTDYNKHTCDFWVYNPTPVANGTLSVEFANAAGVAQYAFEFQLDYSGWRRAVRSFKYDMTGPKTTANFGSVRIKAPATGAGSLFLDAVEWVGPRFTRIRDWQNPGISGFLSDAGFTAYWEVGSDIPLTTPTPEEAAALATARTRWLASAKGTATPSASSVTSAGTSFAALNIIEDANGIRGQTLSSDTAGLEGWSLTLARDAAWGSSATAAASSTKMLQLVRHVHDQGLCAGSNELAAVGSGGYDFRDFPNALVLMAPYYDAATRARVCDMLRWNYQTGRFWTADWERNTDHVHLSSFQMLGAILFLSPDDATAVRELKGYKRFMERFFTPTNGTEGGVKPDGCGFHHGSHYNGYMYALPSASDALYHLRGTPFQVDAATYQNLRSGFLAMMRMSADGTGSGYGYFAQSLCGRNPFSTATPISRDQLRRLGEWGGQTTGAVADALLARAYNRRYGVNDYALFTPYGAEAPPDGFFQFNHSPLGIYRKSNWLASIRGTNSQFWSAEIYSTSNRYGRYQGYGALEILRSGVSAAAAGQQAAGYDWNQPPGTTTIVLPYEKLVAANDREDVRSQLNHAAALALEDGSCGLYACNFQEVAADSNHNPSFRWRKSWFCFGNQIICLGSDIANENALGPTATTLFQSPLATTNTPVTVNGGTTTAFPHDAILPGNAGHWFADAQGNGYWVPAGTDIRLTRSSQTAPNQNGTGAATTGNFAKAWLDHGVSPAGAAYEYAVFPAVNAAGMAIIAASHNEPTTKPYRVLQRDTTAHVVRWLADGTTGYAFFMPGELSAATRNSGLLRSASAVCLAATRIGTADDARISVVDPDMRIANGVATPATVDLVLNGSWSLDATSTGAVIIAAEANTTTLRVATLPGAATHLRLLENQPEVRRWANVGETWTDPANWGAAWGGAPPADDPAADVADLGAATVQPVLHANYAVKGLAMGGGTQLSGTGNLTLGSAGIASNGTTNDCALAGLELVSPQTWTIQDGSLGVSSALLGSSANPLTLAGNGNLTLSGTASHTGGTTVSPGVGGLSVTGDQSAANGGWLIGANASAATTVNFQAGSSIGVAAGKLLRIGNTAATGTATQTLNIAGSVDCAGELLVARPAVLNLTAGGSWLQRGLVKVAAAGGYGALLNVSAGASFTCTSSEPVQLNAAPNSGGQALLVIDGVFSTASGFRQATANTATGFGRITLRNGGTLRLTAPVARMTDGVRLELGTGGGVIDTNGFEGILPANLTGGALTKRGAGSLVITGAASHSGPTVVEAGTLDISGSLGATTVDVRDGAVLAGNGALGGDVTLRSGGRLRFTLAATPAAQSPWNIAGTLTLESGNLIDLTAASLPMAGTYPLATAGAITGTPGVVAFPPFAAGNLRVSGNQLLLDAVVDSYGAWISGFNVGDADGFGDDADYDGLLNGMEFVLSGNPGKAGMNERPNHKLDGDTLLISFPRADAAKDLSIFVETSTDITTWPERLMIGANTASSSAGVTITNDQNDGPDTINVRIPLNSRPQLFARIRVAIAAE